VCWAKSERQAPFLQQVLREDKDKAFVIHFDREVELLQDLYVIAKRVDAALAQLNCRKNTAAGWLEWTTWSRSWRTRSRSRRTWRDAWPRIVGNFPVRFSPVWHPMN